MFMPPYGGVNFPYKTNLNWIIEQIKTLIQETGNLQEAFDKFLDQYQNNLTDTVKKELEEMLNDGTLSALILEHTFYVDVTTLGLVNDGVTDNTERLQAILDDGNTALYFPDGVYVISGNVNISNTSTWISRGGARIFFAGNSDADRMLNVTGTFIADNITFDGNKIGRNVISNNISCNNAKLFLTNCVVSNSRQHGITGSTEVLFLNNVTFDSNAEIAIEQDLTKHAEMNGVYITGTVDSTPIINITADNSVIQWDTDLTDKSATLHVTNCIVINLSGVTIYGTINNSTIFNPEGFDIRNNYSGGKLGDVSTPLQIRAAANKDCDDFVWGIVSTLTNNSDEPNSENVAIYGQAYANKNARTWGACLELIDAVTNNPTAARVGLEINMSGEGDNDTNNSRNLLHLSNHITNGYISRGIYISGGKFHRGIGVANTILDYLIETNHDVVCTGGINFGNGTFSKYGINLSSNRLKFNRSSMIESNPLNLEIDFDDDKYFNFAPGELSIQEVTYTNDTKSNGTFQQSNMYLRINISGTDYYLPLYTRTT